MRFFKETWAGALPPPAAPTQARERFGRTMLSPSFRGVPAGYSSIGWLASIARHRHPRINMRFSEAQAKGDISILR